MNQIILLRGRLTSKPVLLLFMIQFELEPLFKCAIGVYFHLPPLGWVREGVLGAKFSR